MNKRIQEVARCLGQYRGILSESVTNPDNVKLVQAALSTILEDILLLVWWLLYLMKIGLLTLVSY